MLQQRDYFILNTGAKIPAVGLGTWQAQGDLCRLAVISALETGYRHLDCAHLYGNEAEVGDALAEVLDTGAVRREQVFVSSKLLFCHGTTLQPKRVIQAARSSLQNLRLSHLDLYLLHWPPPTSPRHVCDPTDPPRFRTTTPPFSTLLPRLLDTWRAMEHLVELGLVRAIGVSNFDIPQLTHLLSSAKIVPAVNQMELHPLWRQQELVDFCQEKGIHVSAHTPLGVPGSSGDSFDANDQGQKEVLSPRFSRSISAYRPLLKYSYVSQIAERLQKSPAQVVLRWGVQRGTSVLPRSLNLDHIKSNFDILDWSLSHEDWELINRMEPQFPLDHHLVSQLPSFEEKI